MLGVWHLICPNIELCVWPSIPVNVWCGPGRAATRHSCTFRNRDFEATESTEW